MDNPCTEPKRCPFEIQDGNGCCFPHAAISPLSDIKCVPLPPAVTFEGVGEPHIVPDMTQPIIVNLPSGKGDGECSQTTSNRIRVNPVCETDETFPLVVKVLQHPEGDVMKQTANHPLCPDAHLTLTITPQVKKPLEIQIPECKVPFVRPPQRPWLQCVENQNISDRVRRPMARVCHRHEPGPIVIPADQYQRIQMKVTERERMKAEKEARCMDRECERLKSRYRHSLWNYTVESLLDRKKKEQRAKEAAEIQFNQAMVAEIRAEQDRESGEAREKAKKLILYRKGLIKDFHSAMAKSKLQKENADEARKTNRCEEQSQTSPPFLNKICIQKMAWVNDRPQYEKRDEKTPCSKEFLELIEMDEKRVCEREAILQSEKMAAEALRHEEPLPYTEAYLKSIQEPRCDIDGDGDWDNGGKTEEMKKKADRRRELFEDIQDRLTLDAFVEAREKEQERQATCFNSYARDRNRLVKEKEKQIIDDKVKRNIEASERAGAVLVEMQKKKQGRADVYNQLKDQWEKEYEMKLSKKRTDQSNRMGLIYKDYWQRRNEELCKRQLVDVSRHWAREQIDAENNYSMECEVKETRRQGAEELALYHKAQIADKKSREDKAKHIDCVYGYKAKKAYEDEEKEMRDYAQKCMEEWAAKGRPLKPMIQAMKKWDYEGGMYPHAPLRQSAEGAENKESASTNGSRYQTTSNRLGFGAGGC